MSGVYPEDSSLQDPLMADSDLEGWAEHVRSAQVLQTSTCSANRQSVVNLDAEITDRSLNLGMTEEQR